MPQPASPPALTVVSGPEPLRATRAIAAVIAHARLVDPEVEVRDYDAGTLTDAELTDLVSPGLFATRRVAVLRATQDLSEAHRETLLDYARDPLDEMSLVVVHNGSAKGRKLPDALEKAGAAVHRCPAVTRPQERMELVGEEIRRLGGAATAGAVRLLVEAVGSDLLELAAAAAQLVADVPGTIDEAAVSRFHRGRAETRGFDVADAVLAGDSGTALSLLRSALEGGTAPVLVSSALASGLRDLARVRGAGGGPGAAKSLAMPPWKVDKLQRVARGWPDDALARALLAVAAADAGVKGAAVDAGYALERAVLTAVQARGGRGAGPRR